MITLVFFGDLKYCPYINRYLEILDKQDLEYQVLFWNRSGNKLDLPANYKCYWKISALSKGIFSKLIDFYSARQWFIKELEKTHTKKIILLSTLTGIFLFDYLYKSNITYVYDIRDYSFENYTLFRFLEKKIIKRSYFTAISSRGFENFLPNHKYVIAHNFNSKEIKEKYKFKKKTTFPINIVWNGTMRYFDYQKEILNALKNDNRFMLYYHGDGVELEKYKKYCHDNDINNAVFTGSYNNANKSKLLENADIINNAYGSKRKPMEIKYAISNRFYDGLIYKIPQLVEDSSYKAKLIKDCFIGLEYKPKRNIADDLINFYAELNTEKFNSNASDMLDMYLKEDKIFINNIMKFLFI